MKSAALLIYLQNLKKNTGPKTDASKPSGLVLYERSLQASSKAMVFSIIQHYSIVQV